MKLLDYIDITSQTDIDSLLKIANGFHDTLLKEFHLINRAYIDKELKMDMNFEYNARLIIQCQHEPLQIEFLLINISTITLEKPYEIYSGNISKEEYESSFKLSLDDSFSINSQKIYYRLETTKFGNSVFLGGQMPHPEMTESKKIDTNWRLCTNCGETWSEKEDILISVCPECNRVTILNNNE